jgi:hypothetical protein
VTGHIKKTFPNPFMEKLKNYFERIGFEGETLDKILSSFKLQVFKKMSLWYRKEK